MNGNSDNLASRKYISWEAEGVEKIQPNEEEDIKIVCEQTNHMQKVQFNKGRHCFGGTHARTQGIVKAKFIVEDSLPAHLKQTELFDHGGEYDVACRYSSEPGDPGLDDRILQPRGFAMKLFGVVGEKYEAGKDIPTQDIGFYSAPAIELADARTTREILDLRIKYGNDKKELYEHLEQRKDTDLQKARDQVPNTHLESTRYYSQTAYRYGDFVVKYSLVPSSATQKKLAEETPRPVDGDDILHRWLQNFHRDHEAEYLFQVQLLENLEDQPVEYAGSEWDAEKYPWQSVAKLVIPKQDSFIYARKAFWEENLRVDPWLGLKKFQPLGSSNRLRRSLYPVSAGLRRKMNAKEEIHVTTISELP
ncbi:heme-dependent catalase [Tothia fuscella]|uniref:Heme-dependent catalase n=1 Tax=Tothia fuscella TaxID=1048955 RepID=A0A9P4NKK6_9PEZI|nr:heme-dependent catalase [Tothia fuscella]